MSRIVFCSKCNGEGVIGGLRFVAGDYEDTSKVCPRCGGLGRVSADGSRIKVARTEPEHDEPVPFCEEEVAT